MEVGKEYVIFWYKGNNPRNKDNEIEIAIEMSNNKMVDNFLDFKKDISYSELKESLTNLVKDKNSTQEYLSNNGSVSTDSEIIRDKSIWSNKGMLISIGLILLLIVLFGAKFLIRAIKNTKNKN